MSVDSVDECCNGSNAEVETASGQVPNSILRNNAPVDGIPLVSGDEVVTIYKVANGFVVRVGCKTFVKENLGSLIGGLTEWFENPKKAVKEYFSK